ncbi:hypothetical protein ZIOFF_041298 [Zingiber officinale]|uniref:Uncharacterized protein n=1 Tax=Zingiber officinale TaxID=94328 RepID=A0A8J5GH50_ZINOF|nr:hypothetical protein ZIOFF_041298 [Zingiber officinale]
MRRGGELSLSDGWENDAGERGRGRRDLGRFGLHLDLRSESELRFWRYRSQRRVFCLVQEMAEAVTKDFGRIDIFVHSLANGPELLPYTII